MTESTNLKSEPKFILTITAEFGRQAPTVELGAPAKASARWRQHDASTLAIEVTRPVTIALSPAGEPEWSLGNDYQDLRRSGLNDHLQNWIRALRSAGATSSLQVRLQVLASTAFRGFGPPTESKSAKPMPALRPETGAPYEYSALCEADQTIDRVVNLVFSEVWNLYPPR